MVHALKTTKTKFIRRSLKVYHLSKPIHTKYFQKRKLMIIKYLRSPKRFLRSKSVNIVDTKKDVGEIKWEMRPDGMLVQKRENGEKEGEILISIRVSTVSQWHDITIQPTSTFGELKKVLSMVTSLEPREQRLLFKGKEREDREYLHMVGVRDKGKVFLFEDPSVKEREKSP